MNCVDVKRQTLSDPNSTDTEYREHLAGCADCRTYRAEIQKMDMDLAKSLDVTVPSDLVARLQLTQEMIEEDQSLETGTDDLTTKSNVISFQPARRYAIAASFALALFVAGFMASNQFSHNAEVSQDYELLLSAVMEHTNHVPITPVWSSARANESVNALLASYDGKMQMRYLDSLQFGRICPMGQYRGLHATLDTSDGQVTFAYIKGAPVEELIDMSYEGYISRVKPMREGNLVILSRTEKAMNEADQRLNDAIYYDI